MTWRSDTDERTQVQILGLKVADAAAQGLDLSSKIGGFGHGVRQ